MKLKNLHESFEQQIGPLPDKSNSGKTLGGGWFASVTDDEDPHMVNKATHRQDPAYAAYVDFLLKNKLAQANPHFPRIYEIGNGQWKMEKLPYTLSQFFEVQDYDQYINNKDMIGNMYLKDFDPNRITSWDFDSPTNIKLGTYRKALELVHAARIAYNETNPEKRLTDDLHPGNIMVRLTPQGPQLVITDPWS